MLGTLWNNSRQDIETDRRIRCLDGQPIRSFQKSVDGKGCRGASIIDALPHQPKIPHIAQVWSASWMWFANYSPILVGNTCRILNRTRTPSHQSSLEASRTQEFDGSSSHYLTSLMCGEFQQWIDSLYPLQFMWGALNHVYIWGHMFKLHRSIQNHRNQKQKYFLKFFLTGFDDKQVRNNWVMMGEPNRSENSGGEDWASSSLLKADKWLITRWNSSQKQLLRRCTHKNRRESMPGGERIGVPRTRHTLRAASVR